MWVGCTVPRRVFDELRAREVATRIYRTRIIASLISEGLIGAVVDRELRVSSQPPANTAHGSPPR